MPKEKVPEALSCVIVGESVVPLGSNSGLFFNWLSTSKAIVVFAEGSTALMSIERQTT